MKHHVSEDEMTLHYYGEQEDDGVASHLRECASCAAQYKELQDLLGEVSQMEVPERGPDYGTQVWRRIAPQLKTEPSIWERIQAWIQITFKPGNMAMAAAFALIAALAFMIGRYGPKPPEAPLTEVVSSNLFKTKVSGHLEQLQMLLTDVKHGEGDTQDVALRQEWAEQLAFDNRLYRQAANRNEDPTLTAFLEELEFTLLEIANGDEPVIEMEKIERNQEHTEILFKIRVLRSDMKPQSLYAAPEDDRAL